MKYLKTYERLIKQDFSKLDTEILKIKKFLSEVIDNDKDYVIIDSNEIYYDESFDKGYKTVSLILDVYENYFVFQFDYKEDGLWIKFLNSCHNPDLKESINLIGKFFNIIANKHNEYGWRFDKDQISKELDRLDDFINSKKYNL